MPSQPKVNEMPKTRAIPKRHVESFNQKLKPATRKGIRRFAFPLIIIVVVIIGCLSLVEIALRFKPICLGPLCTHPIYGRMGNGLNPDIDELGFRNISVPNNICVAFMGDSQVYGSGVGRDSTFVSRLVTDHKLPAYNMGIPGTSILNQAQMVRFAGQVRPEIVYLSFYPGNDLLDLYTETSGQGTITAEEISRYELDLREFPTPFDYESRWRDVKNQTVPYLGGLKYSHLRQVTQALEDFAVMRSALAVVKLFKTRKTSGDLKKLSKISIESAWGVFPGTDTLFINDGDMRDVFESEFRVLAVDDSRSEVAVAIRNASHLFSRTTDSLRKQGVEPRVLFIPTKERVYADFLVARGLDLPQSYRDQIVNEKRIVSMLKERVQNDLIHTIDLLPTLKDSVARGVHTHLFFDGHMNSVGHAIAAEAIAADLGTHTCARDSSAPFE